MHKQTLLTMGRKRDPQTKDAACGTDQCPVASASSTWRPQQSPWWSADNQWSQPNRWEWPQPNWWWNEPETDASKDTMPQQSYRSQPNWWQKDDWADVSADAKQPQQQTDSYTTWCQQKDDRTDASADAKQQQTGCQVAWWPKRAKAAAETETSRADLLEAAEKNQFYNDVDFLRRQEEKDRKRRAAHRHNLKERRWEAWERISMLENDTLDGQGPAGKNRKRSLASQVLQVASELSNSLPKTPTEMKQGEKAPTTPGFDPQLDEPADETKAKRMKPDHHEVFGEPQLLQLNEWMVGTFFHSQPTDPGLALNRIDRKDAKYRWASYSRVPPRLNRGSPQRFQAEILPPYGIQLIADFNQWKTQQFPKA